LEEPALTIGFERDHTEKELNLEDFDIPSWLSKETVKQFLDIALKILKIQ
jgi:hypothetical protein